jgi:hypothetical protein
MTQLAVTQSFMRFRPLVNTLPHYCWISNRRNITTTSASVKVVSSADEAVSDIQDGAKVSFGFLGCDNCDLDGSDKILCYFLLSMQNSCVLAALGCVESQKTSLLH